MMMIEWYTRYKAQNGERLEDVKKRSPEEFEALFEEFKNWEPELTEHKLSVSLTMEEWNDLGRMARDYGMSRSKLIEHFVRDLSGDRRSGSDEERLANEWYQRNSCNFRN